MAVNLTNFRSNCNNDFCELCLYRLRMSMGYKVSYLGLPATIIWLGQQKWLLKRELGSPGWCARKKMPQIQWWVLITIFPPDLYFTSLYFSIWLTILSVWSFLYVLISCSLLFLNTPLSFKDMVLSCEKKFWLSKKKSFPLHCWQINTCNGFYCDAFSPNKPYKPTIWTEAWSGWYVINILFIFAF